MESYYRKEKRNRIVEQNSAIVFIMYNIIKVIVIIRELFARFKRNLNKIIFLKIP